MAYCTTCGSEIPSSANFCKYCGATVKSKNKESSDKPVNSQKQSASVHHKSLYDQPAIKEDVPPVKLNTDSSPVASTTDQESYYPDPNKMAQPVTTTHSKTPIPEDIIDILYSREREEDIKAELKDILAEIEKIEQRLDVGLTEGLNASEQIQDKNLLIQALRGERNSLRLKQLPIEIHQNTMEEAQKKKDKTEEMRSQGKIERESVYLRLIQEFQIDIDEATKEFNEQKRLANGWVRQLQEETHTLKDEAEIVMTRADLGEITKEEAQNRREEIEIDIYRKELAYHALVKVLEIINQSSEK